LRRWRRAGLPTPSGFCLTASAYPWQIAALGLDDVARPLALGRRRRPCGQLNDFVRGFNAVIHGYPDYRVAFLNHHSSRFGSFSRRV
jgi:hypothetical protein